MTNQPEIVETMLPVWTIAVPLITTLVLIFVHRQPMLRHLVSFLGTAATFGTVLAMYPLIAAGGVIYYQVPFFITPLDLTFRVDGLGFLIALISSFVWLASTIYAISYMDHEENQGRFFIFLALTFAGVMGVPLSGDFLSLLIFFEVMTLASYVLVIHTESKAAMFAGNLFLYMGVFGGLCILIGIGIIYELNESVLIAPSMEAFSELTTFHLVAVVLMMIGFGIKAGMVPLHIWLPRAHPVAPAPASALLSAIMIKTGAYGIIRTVNMLITPQADRGAVADTAEQFAGAWEGLAGLGYGIIWIGMITMFFGAVMAIMQDNVKKMLACSSISQMGYIIMGVGVAAYMGYSGAMGLAGTSYHILSHALFKSALFLVAGVFAYLLHDLDMRNMGGLARKFPFTTGVAIIASLGIMGMPLFNGYPSKTLLHHAIEYAWHHEDLFSLLAAEWLFTLTSACTVCYFIKFLYHTFFRKTDRDYSKIKTEPLLMKAGMSILAVAMLAVGLLPHLIHEKLIMPALGGFMFDQYYVDYVAKNNFWVFSDILAVFIAIALGVFIYFLVMKTKFHQLKIPAWLGQERWGFYLGRVAIIGWGYLGLFTEAMMSFSRHVSGSVFRSGFGLFQSVDYKPGRSKVFRTVNIGNIDFSVFIIMVILGMVLVFLFILQFGADVIGG